MSDVGELLDELLRKVEKRQHELVMYRMGVTVAAARETSHEPGYATGVGRDATAALTALRNDLED